MRWVKHMTASHDDDKLADLISQFGHAGYGTWWLVVEIVGARLEAGGDPCVTYPVSKWSNLLSVRGSHVRQTLMRLVVTHLVTLEWTGTHAKVTIPNLLKYRDEYSKKSGHSPDSVRPKKQIQNTDTETDAHTPSVRAVLPVLRSPNADDLNCQTSQRFDEWFAIWAGVRGNAYRMNACSQFLSVVIADREQDAMDCTRSYVAGPGSDPSHGYRPDRFLAEMARDSFKTRWPARQAAPQRGETAMEQAKRMATEQSNGKK